MTPLYGACQEGHVAVARLLLDKGAEVDRAREDGATPLFAACSHGHVDAARLLLEKGADASRVTKKGTTPLSIAQKKGHSDIVELLESHLPPPPPRGADDATYQPSAGAPEEKDDFPPPGSGKLKIHEEAYEDIAARAVADETKLTEHQKELKRLKRLLTERETDHLTCPITYEIYEDPVIAADGYSYERRERCPHQATVVF